jgi:hypothetical protein
MSPFEVVHGYKRRKPLDLLLMSPHARVSESDEAFAHAHDLHDEISKQIQASNAQYKLQVNSHRHHTAFSIGDSVMVRIKP